MGYSDPNEEDIEKEYILSLLKRHLFKDIPFIMGTAIVVYDEVY